MERTANGDVVPTQDSVTSSGGADMEKTTLLDGDGDPVTSSTGARKDYGGAEQRTPAQQHHAGTFTSDVILSN